MRVWSRVFVDSQAPAIGAWRGNVVTWMTRIADNDLVVTIFIVGVESKP
jgi:hypothetical protein